MYYPWIVQIRVGGGLRCADLVPKCRNLDGFGYQKLVSLGPLDFDSMAL